MASTIFNIKERCYRGTYVALVLVNMPIKSAFQTVVFSKRKLLFNEIQIMFDQALFLNTNALF